MMVGTKVRKQRALTPEQRLLGMIDGGRTRCIPSIRRKISNVRSLLERPHQSLQRQNPEQYFLLLRFDGENREQLHVALYIQVALLEAQASCNCRQPSRVNHPRQNTRGTRTIIEDRLHAHTPGMKPYANHHASLRGIDRRDRS